MGEIKDFADGVEYIARQVAENTPRDITQKGRITAVVGTGLYTVLINGKTYASVPTNPIGITTLAVNDIVWCMAPQGNYALMFILTGGSGETPTPGTTDYNALSNKPSINSVELVGNKTLQQLGIINDKNFIFTQYSAASEWNIAHNLNKYPSVVVVDSADTVVVGDIQYINLNSVLITFNDAFSGMAYLN